MYKQSYSYIQQKDLDWAELKKVLHSKNSSQCFLIWISHPTLDVYTLRLIPWAGKSAYSRSSTNFYQSFNPTGNVLMGKQEPIFVNPKEFKRVLVVDTKLNRPVYKLYDTLKFNQDFSAISALP